MSLMQSAMKLDLKPALLGGLEDCSIDTAHPGFRRIVQAILSGEDCVIEAPIYSKTIDAVLTGILQMVDKAHAQTQVLVLCPRRALAVDIHKRFGELGKDLDLKYYLTMPRPPRAGELSCLPQIVLGTPGRVNQLNTTGVIDTRSLSLICLMAADEILSAGFEDAVKNILRSCSLPHRTSRIIALCGTLLPDLTELAAEFMDNPRQVHIESNVNVALIEGLRHTVKYVACEEDKLAAICDLFNANGLLLAIMVCSTDRLAYTVSDDLNIRGLSSCAWAADMTQQQRGRSTVDFLSGTCRLLIVAESFALRTNLHRLGDVSRPSVIINYDLPTSIEDYGRRIDPRANMGYKPLIINLVLERDKDRLKEIADFYELEMEALDLHSQD